MAKKDEIQIKASPADFVIERGENRAIKGFTGLG